MDNQQAWRMRFSYRNATILVCFFNLVTALLLLHGFFTASSNGRARGNHIDPAKLRYIMESEEMRRAMEPLELIKRVREIGQESYIEPETEQQIIPKRTAAVDLSKRLKDFRAMNDANSVKGYFLNSRFQYDPKTRCNDDEVLVGLKRVIERIEPDEQRQTRALEEVTNYKHRIGDFGTSRAWHAIGDLTPALEEWRKRKIERERQREIEKNGTSASQA